MFGFNDPMQQQQFRKPETLSQKIRRFLKTQPVLALLIGQAITLYVMLGTTFFYGLTFVLFLYFGGLFLRQYYSDLVLVGVYLSGALSGYLLFAVMFGGNLLQPGAMHLAAIQGSAVLALLTFPAVAKPDLRMRVFLLMSVRFWHITSLLTVIVILMRDSAGGGTHLCYLGGALLAALTAWIFVRNFSGLPAMTFLKRRMKVKRNKEFAKYETVKEEGRPLRDEVYNDIRADRQKKIDEILDKISVSGYDSLTSTEKELLFRHSK